MDGQADTAEFSYEVADWQWRDQPHSVLRRARAAAKQKRKNIDGEPRVRVVLEWRGDPADSAA
jgi:hypothetical protein